MGDAVITLLDKARPHMSWKNWIRLGMEILTQLEIAGVISPNEWGRVYMHLKDTE